jgi:thiamine biosynthesis lipoprotein
MRAKRLLSGLCCVLAMGCSARVAEGPVQERLFAMGTWVDVTVVGLDADAAAAALGDVEARLRTVERDYYPWTEGQLADLNAAIAEGRSMETGSELVELLQQAQSLSAASDGAFEPGIGRLVELWGFNASDGGDRDPPSPDAIVAALPGSGGIAALRFDGNRVSSTSRQLKIDLGGIAKGAVVADLLEMLTAHGSDAILVNAGGDLAALGTAPGGRPWRIGIRDPRAAGLLGSVDLGSGESAFTSGDYERFYERDGERLHHLLDPRTGRPAGHTQAVTVIADDPVLADAAATALFVAGPETWRTVAERLGVTDVLRVGADGEIETTASMRARLQPAGREHDIIMGSGKEPLD